MVNPRPKKRPASAPAPKANTEEITVEEEPPMDEIHSLSSESSGMRQRTVRPVEEEIEVMETRTAEDIDVDAFMDEIDKNTTTSRPKGESGWGCTLLWVVSIVALLALVLALRLGEDHFHHTKGGEEKAINYYEILEISKKAEFDEIKKGFRKQSLKWHPDRCREDAEVCAERMSLISEAYDVLSYPETRSYHDTYGIRPPQAMLNIAKSRHGGRSQKN